jgi:hypothetical protein
VPIRCKPVRRSRSPEAGGSPPLSRFIVSVYSPREPRELEPKTAVGCPEDAFSPKEPKR